jgi:hypothetical protein
MSTASNTVGSANPVWTVRVSGSGEINVRTPYSTGATMSTTPSGTTIHRARLRSPYALTRSG